MSFGMSFLALNGGEVTLLALNGGEGWIDGGIGGNGGSWASLAAAREERGCLGGGGTIGGGIIDGGVIDGGVLAGHSATELA